MQIRHNFICVKFKFVAFILIYEELMLLTLEMDLNAFVEVQVFLQNIFEKGCK